MLPVAHDIFGLVGIQIGDGAQENGLARSRIACHTNDFVRIHLETYIIEHEPTYVVNREHAGA